MGKLDCPKERHEKTVSKMQMNFLFMWKFSLTFIKDFEGGFCLVASFSILILLFKKKEKKKSGFCLSSEIEGLLWQGGKQEECCFQEKEISTQCC